MVAMLENFSISGIADGIRTGAFSAESVAEEVLDRCARFSELNAIIFQVGDALLAGARDADAALKRGEAAGPLHGVPILINANLAVPGLPCSAGTAALENDYPRQDATAVYRLRATHRVWHCIRDDPCWVVASTGDLPCGRGARQL